MVGLTCLNEITSALAGVQTRNRTFFIDFDWALATASRNAASMPSGSGISDALPSRARAIICTSPTCQLVPTPQQSQVKIPAHRRSSSSTAEEASDSFLPSVRKMHWPIASGEAANSDRAADSPVDIAVPPSATSDWSSVSARCLASSVALAGRTIRRLYVLNDTTKNP